MQARSAHPGVVAVATLLLATFLTGCGAAVAPEPRPVTAFAVPTQRSDPADVAAAVAEDVVAGLDAFWADDTGLGAAWSPLRVVGAYQPGGNPTCDGGPVAGEGNAYYCSPDDYVAWDSNFFTALVEEDAGEGARAIAFALAHEWGHAAQVRAATPVGEITAELLSDCLAGAWLSATFEPDATDPGTLHGAILALYEAGRPGAPIEPHERYRDPSVRAEAATEGARTGVDGCFESHAS